MEKSPTFPNFGRDVSHSLSILLWISILLLQKPFSPLPVNIDICDYLEAGKYPTERLYFSPATYPPPQNDEEMQCAERNNKCEGWLNIKRDLQVASLDEGNFGIYSNGGGSGTKSFVCATTHRERGKKSRMKNIHIVKHPLFTTGKIAGRMVRFYQGVPKLMIHWCINLH